MFEKCGILDVFYAIKKNLVLIAAATLIGSIIGFTLSALQPNSSQGNTQGKDFYVASACFLVQADNNALTNKIDSLSELEIQKAESVTAIVKADFTREKIFNKLLEKYSKEDIIQCFDLNCDVDSLSSMHLKKALQGSVIWSTPISNIYVLGCNKALCEDYLEIAKTYLLEAANSVGNCTATYLDGVSLNDVEKEKELENATPSVSSDKLWIVLSLLGFAISVAFVIFKAIFFPTVTRRSDFAHYKLNVLGEVSISGKVAK